MRQKSKKAFLAAIGLSICIGTVAYAVRVDCVEGPQLAGGCSDTSTVAAGATFSYTVYATDNDTPQIGGNPVMDKGLNVSDHSINSIPFHNAPDTQGDDTTAGKRTFTVSRVAAEPSCPGEDVIYEDQFKFDDGLPSYDDDYVYANDSQTSWYTKAVIVQVPAAP